MAPRQRKKVDPNISRVTGKPKKKPRGKPANDARAAGLLHKKMLEEQLGITRKIAYTPEIAEVIITKIGRGQSIQSIANEPGMPCSWTIHDWLRKHEEFCEAYEKARPARARAIAEKAHSELEAIPDGDRDAAYIGDVRIRNRLKLAAIFDPRRYSERHIVEHTGDVAIQLSVNLSRFSDEQKAIELEATEVPTLEGDQN